MLPMVGEESAVEQALYCTIVRLERSERLEHGPHLGIEIGGGQRTRDPGDADDVALIGGSREGFGVGQSDEEPPGPPSAGELQEGVDASGEVVAVEGGAQSRHGPSLDAGPRRLPRTGPKTSVARRRASEASSADSAVSPRAADSHASRMLLTPAADPSGWPWMPPPASTSRSVVPTAA